MTPDLQNPYEGSGEMPQTDWGAIRDAASHQAELQARGLEKFCSHYVSPIYWFIRRKGHDKDAAKDKVHDFLARVLDPTHAYFSKVTPQAESPTGSSPGSFRRFLLVSLDNFLKDGYRHAAAKKRGSGIAAVRLDWDPEDEEQRGIQLADSSRTPDEEFDYRWASVVLARAMTRLKAVYRQKKMDNRFEVLQSRLTDGANDETMAAAAERLGMTEDAVKVEIHRMRDRYRRLLRDELRDTVSESDAIGDELDHLRQVLRRASVRN